MSNSLYKDLLGSMDRSELNEFGRFIHSPYFNNRSEVVRFFEAVKKYHPLFEAKDIEEVRIFRKIYPGKKYSPVMMRKVYSLTSNLFMDFIAVKSFKRNKLEYNIKVMDALRERKMTGKFEKKSRQVAELLESNKRDLNYYESRMKHTSILNGYYLNTDQDALVEGFQQELYSALDYFFVVVMVEYLRLGEWSKMINRKYDLRFYDEVSSYFESRKEKQVDLAYLYFNMMRMLNTQDEKYYHALIKGRDEFEEHLSKLDEFNISIVLIQYCYGRTREGDFRFRRNQFDITNKIIEKDLIPGGFVDPYFFSNTVRNAAALMEHDWAEDFIKNFHSRLNPELAGEMFEYAYAMIETSRKNHKKALMHLSKISLWSHMKAEIKNLTIVNSYELGYSEEVESQIDAYRHFLASDKTLSENTKHNNSIFLNFVSTLNKTKLSIKNGDMFTLRKEIQNTPYFVLKDWLIEKTGELSSKK